MRSIFNFLQTTVVLGALIALNSCKTENRQLAKADANQDTLSITVLQTADIHGQLDPHPELFWDEGNIVFQNRGGMANIKTLFNREREANPGRTLIVDGGDLIQGSGYAALSEGKVMTGLIKNMV